MTRSRARARLQRARLLLLLLRPLEAEAVLRDLLEGSGVDVEVYEPLPGRMSVVARLEGRRRQAPSLALLGHTDVVPANGEVLDLLRRVFPGV